MKWNADIVVEYAKQGVTNADSSILSFRGDLKATLSPFDI